MNKLKIVLLYPLLAVPLSYSMEQEVELPAQLTSISTQQSRVPSLKHLILSKIGSLLVKKDAHVSVSALEKVYQEAKVDCARVIAEDQRVALWNKFGENKKTVELDHCALIANGFADEVRQNTVYAATFTPDDQFLLTLTCKRDVQENYVVNVWRVSDLTARLRNHKANASQGEATASEIVETEAQLIQAEMSQNNDAANLEEIEQLEPVKPCNEFIIRPMNYCISHMFNMLCDQTGSLVVLTLPFGDCHFLRLSSEGILTRLWRLNILPIAKELRANEGTPEEDQLNQADSRMYVKLLSFNRAGNKLLLHIAKNPDNEKPENKRGGELYWIPVDHTTFLASAPVINALDDTYKIADEVDAAVWRKDGTISFIETDHYNILRTINTEGDEIGKKALKFEGIEKVLVQVDRLELGKSSDELIIFSDYRSYSWRIDRCNLNNDSSIRLYDGLNGEDKLEFNKGKWCGEPAYLQFLPHESFALKIFHNRSKVHVILWNMREDCCATIAAWEISEPYYEFRYALSSDGSYIYIADTPILGDPCKLSLMVSLQTPFDTSISLEELIGLCDQ